MNELWVLKNHGRGWEELPAIAIAVFEDGTVLDCYIGEDGFVDIFTEGSKFTIHEFRELLGRDISEFLFEECEPASREVAEKFWRDYAASKL